ncbi:hypothetical protein CYMTET_21012 [Cymbomonas tetramitiformis]|uniref:Nudix hydrolase domain-containing protein n=1 Tax=Cymbomonas tetramitiformis TaxID=36881 RepID=A0AAE0G2V2_9CHLO|nr:hypothetical protein CYMTET_21012 [Cymbomonas tetramitiformis]
MKALSDKTNPVQKTDELVDIVDEGNNVIQSATRAEMRARNAIHRCSFVLVFNSKGKLFVQKRVSWKETYPSHFDPCPGGVVGAGESYEDNARREAEEEMGVHGVPLHPLFDFFFEDSITRLWGSMFFCVYDGTMVLQKEEVESGEFMDLESVKHLILHEPCCPDSKAGFETFIEEHYNDQFKILLEESGAG